MNIEDRAYTQGIIQGKRECANVLILCLKEIKNIRLIAETFADENSKDTERIEYLNNLIKSIEFLL